VDIRESSEMSDFFCKMEIRCRKRMGSAGKSYGCFWVESNCNGFEKTESNDQKSLSRPKVALIQQRRIYKMGEPNVYEIGNSQDIKLQ
jgi:hypothetical protein